VPKLIFGHEGMGTHRPSYYTSSLRQCQVDYSPDPILGGLFLCKAALLKAKRDPMDRCNAPVLQTAHTEFLGASRKTTLTASLPGIYDAPFGASPLPFDADERRWTQASSPSLLSAGFLTGVSSQRQRLRESPLTQASREQATINRHTDMVLSVAYSLDGKTLASGNGDHTIKLWDVATDKERATLQGHIYVVFSVAYSPEGKTLASGSADNTIGLWDVATGK
jgi:hypothetical protein